MGRFHPGNTLLAHELIGKLCLGVDPDAPPLGLTGQRGEHRVVLGDGLDVDGDVELVLSPSVKITPLSGGTSA